MALVNNGAAVIIEEKDLTGDRLLAEINKLISDREKLKEIGSNAKKMATLNAKEQIADIVLGLIK
jgi:UDP-N-acetylglucosamine--N-acetylmuramyl-(pentapeptide) pyrophosphoryl-undecaprenol N-acetylglucosamine transferase